jgi:peroxiredoxin
MSELRGLQSRISEIRSSGADLVAISVDGVADNRRVVDKLGLEFPVLSDRTGETIADYGVVHEGAGPGGRSIARPAILLVGPGGTVRWRDLTDNWRIRARPETILQAIHKAG